MSQIPYSRLLDSYPAIAPAVHAGRLTGKNVLITGCSVGIGRATAQAFAAAGANVACVARRQAQLDALVRDIHGQGSGASGTVAAVPGDVTASGAADDIVSRAEAALGGPVDVLVNIAGKTRLGPLEMEDEGLEKWWGVFDLNVRAPVALMRRVLPGMMERKYGVLMSVSSVNAAVAFPALSAYSSSKAAISKVHEMLVPELKGTGVLSFAVNPGIVETELGVADDAINQEAMGHPAVKAFMETHAQQGGNSKASLPADTMVALVADERAKALTGCHLNADQDLEEVFKEIEKPNGGRIEKEGLYRIRIGQLGQDKPLGW